MARGSGKILRLIKGCGAGCPDTLRILPLPPSPEIWRVQETDPESDQQSFSFAAATNEPESNEAESRRGEGIASWPNLGTKLH